MVSDIAMPDESVLHRLRRDVLFPIHDACVDTVSEAAMVIERIDTGVVAATRSVRRALLDARNDLGVLWATNSTTRRTS
jgi:hypothetical protein